MRAPKAPFEIYFIPFHGQYLIYRPLVRLAFVGNRALSRYLRRRMAAPCCAGRDPQIEDFLDAIDFWRNDPDVSVTPPLECPHKPTGAVLMMTTACNLACVYCYAHAGETPPKQMTLELAKPVIDCAYSNARELERDRFSLTFHGGGEPTANWDVLVAATEYARSKDLPCDISMSTNGVWTDRQREWIIGNLSGVSLSFDGIQPVQDAQRPRLDGTGSYDSVMETIRAFDAAGTPYGVRMTVTPGSFEALPAGVELLCEQTGCMGIQVEPSYSSERGNWAHPSPEDGERFVSAFLDAFEIAARHGRHFYYSGARPWAVTASFCTAPYSALVVTPDGDLVTCFEATDRNHPMAEELLVGRVCPDEGISVDRSRLAAHYARQEARRDQCRGCFCYWHCAGDCITRCAGPELKERGQGRCQVNRRITADLLAWYVAAGDGVWTEKTELLHSIDGPPGAMRVAGRAGAKRITEA